LRFLSEFSQEDAVVFDDFAKNCFRDIAPSSLVKPPSLTDITNLINLESAGLIQGGSGFGLEYSLHFDENRTAAIIEGNLALVFKGNPGHVLKVQILSLTPLGKELVSLLPGRDARQAARRVAEAMRTMETEEAYLMIIDSQREIKSTEIIWQSPLGKASTIIGGVD
jgi:hypothetical protein